MSNQYKHNVSFHVVLVIFSVARSTREQHMYEKGSLEIFRIIIGGVSGQ